MKCVFQKAAKLRDDTLCENPAVPGHGIVPASFCTLCPWRIETVQNDFFSQTSLLLIQKQRRGEYVARQRPCGGCPDTKVEIVPESRTAYTSGLNWAVTITTAPRAVNYLPECLQSLSAAGWSDPVVFAEPGSPIPAGVITIQNEARRGCFHNWLHSARWALENTTAQQILMMQDDAFVHPDSRQFVEQRCLWPPDAAFVSLYCPSHYAKKRTGILRVTTRNLWGTCAMIWRRDILQSVVESKVINEWLGLPPGRNKGERSDEHRARRIAFQNDRRSNPNKINNSDYAAGLAVVRLRRKMYYISPSPARHIATVSSIAHGGNAGERNCGPCADHTRPLADQVFPEKQAA